MPRPLNDVPFDAIVLGQPVTSAIGNVGRVTGLYGSNETHPRYGTRAEERVLVAWEHGGESFQPLDNYDQVVLGHDPAWRAPARV